MTKEVKEAYKKASAELETIIKTTFSLPFETPYTDKTRVKLTADDKKLLNDCYIRDFLTSSIQMMTATYHSKSVRLTHL